jgi:hypothetical protein
MSTKKMFLNLPLMARLIDDDPEDKEEKVDTFDDGNKDKDNIDEEWGADISVGDEEEEKEKKEKEEENEEEENE